MTFRSGNISVMTFLYKNNH